MHNTTLRGSFILACTIGLSACGPDTLGAAATSASVKATETQQGQATLERVDTQLQQSLQLMEQRKQKADQQ